MSASFTDHKKRPPPIAIPAWPLAQMSPERGNVPTRTNADGQRAQRFVSSSTQQGVQLRPAAPLASPLELDNAHVVVPTSGSQASRHRSSAMTTVSDLIDQACRSPRKVDRGSVQSRHGSTTRSRQSERSHRSATAAQARLEALGEDESTIRSQIESRSERKLFKMTGQIPPTPAVGT